MEKWKKRSVDLLTSLYLGASEEGSSVIPYYPQKCEISSSERRYFHRSTPEKQGISSRRICAMLSELEGESCANIHNLLLLRRGQVIAECSREGYDVNLFHLSHSMSKSVTSLLLGTLFDEGKLDLEARLVEIFPELEYRDRRFPLITVEHLLSMRAGVDFSEAGAVTESDWTEAFFKSAVKFTPGTSFSYNSMNSYILARIAERISGRQFGELLKERIFSPLKIENYLWEIGPEGCEKGGWGLYLSAESWAKLGCLALYKGDFFGRRVISEKWIDMSARVISTPKETGTKYGYGYHIWASDRGEILYNGMLGQNVWIWREEETVAVIQSGNNEMFSESPSVAILRKYLLGKTKDTLHRHDVRALYEREHSFFDSRMAVRPLKKERGFMYRLGLKESGRFDDRWRDILGSYMFAENSVGLLPLFVRSMQNNLHSFIERVKIWKSDESLYLSVTESGVEYDIKVGLYGYEECVLDFRGEKYMVKALGEARISKSGEREFRIELLFPELPNTRMIQITIPSENTIRMRFSELPDSQAVDELVERMPEGSPIVGFAFGLLSRGFGEDFITKRTEEAFSPVLIGVDAEFEGRDSILYSEGINARKRARIGRLLHLIVDRLFGDEDETPKEKAKRGAFISELLALIRASDESDKKK